MKKILIALALWITPLIGQAPEIADPDQFQMFTSASGAIMHKMMERCRSQGYKYFMITKLTYKDGKGQKGEFIGISDKTGVVLKDTMSEEDKDYGKVSVSIEVVAYKTDPKNPLAADVDKYHQMIEAFQQANGQ